jgi:hypothetical protein
VCVCVCVCVIIRVEKNKIGRYRADIGRSKAPLASTY